MQPFGGERLSGTGPKAGGPHYLPRFATERTVSINTAAVGGNASLLSLDETPSRASGAVLATARQPRHGSTSERRSGPASAGCGWWDACASYAVWKRNGSAG